MEGKYQIDDIIKQKNLKRKRIRRIILFLALAIIAALVLIKILTYTPLSKEEQAKHIVSGVLDKLVFLIKNNNFDKYQSYFTADVSPDVKNMILSFNQNRGDSITYTLGETTINMYPAGITEIGIKVIWNWKINNKNVTKEDYYYFQKKDTSTNWVISMEPYTEKTSVAGDGRPVPSAPIQKK